MVFVQAIVTGVLVVAAGSLPWGCLANVNLKYTPNIAWAVPVAAFYLWLLLRYLHGSGWPKSTAAARRDNLRANPISGRVWAWALVSGSLGIASMVMIMRVMGRLVILPHEQAPAIGHVPFITVFLMAIMGSLNAGVVEEAAFRGYLQRPIEKRYGPTAAIIITGFLFGLAHFTHPEVTAIMLPYYLIASGVYGMLAYYTDSILPGLVLHASGNFIASIDLLIKRHDWWQKSALPPSLVWKTGADASFWLACALLVLFSASAILSYRKLAHIARQARHEV